MNTFDFIPLTLDSEADFLPFQDSCRFGDTTFRTLYAWQPMFGYRYAKAEGFMVLTDQDSDLSILFRKPETDLADALRQLLAGWTGTLKLGYILQEDLPAFRAAAEGLGIHCQAYCEDKYSDYIYKAEDYCSLSGSRQKSLRGDVNALLKQIPDIRVEPFRPEYAATCLDTFSRWCAGRNCAHCYYGCEREAMARFLQVYREPECFGALAFSGDQILSFLLGEILPGGVLDIHFQKNAFRQRGLTYWLSRELVLNHPSCKWIDLEEDMGLPGIRLDKQRLHPYEIKHKYTVVLQP